MELTSAERRRRPGRSAVPTSQLRIFSTSDAFVIGVLEDLRRRGEEQRRLPAHVGSQCRTYTIYVNGGFSTDATFKVDFFDLNRSAAESRSGSKSY
jgi:hypothetical protein